MSGTVSAEPLWQLSGVQLHRASQTWPEQPLTLTIPQGLTAVLGVSGAGKTSLLNLLVGYLKPDRGTIRHPEKMSWVPQNHGLWAKHRAIEHLTFCGASVADAEHLLERFDLTRQSDALAEDLSMGEAARLVVARALAQSAPVLVMDEPLAHIDPARAGKYWRALRGSVDASGGSFVFATHQPEIALAHAQHAICLRDGLVIYQGNIANLYEAPPTPDLAAQLGPINWLVPEEINAWLGRSSQAPVCIRPERLAIEPAESAPNVVMASRFHGSYAETELQSNQSGIRTFLHRPPRALAVGTRVHLREVPRG